MKFNRSAVAAVLSAALVLSACGGEEDAAEDTTVVSPAITVGAASDSLSQVLAAIWSQSLTDAGYRVARKDPLPDAAAAYAALEADTLQLAPQLSSTLLRSLAGGEATDARNIDTQIEALASRLPDSLVTADPTTADAGTALACTTTAVAEGDLSSFEDAFAALDSLTIAAVPGTDLDRIGEVYETDLSGLEIVEAADVAARIQDDSIDCAMLSALSPAIVTAGLLPLVDERGVIAVDAPIPIIAAGSATPDVTALLAQVNAALTTEVVRALLVKLTDPANTPNSVAKGFLATFSEQPQG